MTNYERGEDGKLLIVGLPQKDYRIRDAFVTPMQFGGVIDIQQQMEVVKPKTEEELDRLYTADGVPLRTGMKINFINDAHTKYNRPPNAPSIWGRGKSFAARQRRQRKIAWGFPE